MSNSECVSKWLSSGKVCFSRALTPSLFASTSLKMETKSKGLREQQQHHKKLLAAMLSQDSFDSVHSPAPSIAEEEMEDEDDAMELLGNAIFCACTTCLHMQTLS